MRRIGRHALEVRPGIRFGPAISFQVSGLTSHPGRIFNKLAATVGRASASAEIAAPPSRVYAILIDYREEHPLILPSRWFRELEVETGGIGAGTRLRVTMRVLGATRTIRQVVTEPEPGRVLVEADLDGAAVTTFTVDPVDGRPSCRVTIATELKARPGVLGLVERLLVARILTTIYREELTLLGQRAAV